MIEELKSFILMVKTITLGYDGSKIEGITEEDLDRVVSKKTKDWLQKNHYISIHKERPIWISWSNKYHPKATIDELEKLVKKLEQNH